MYIFHNIAIDDYGEACVAFRGAMRGIEVITLPIEGRPQAFRVYSRLL